MGTFHDITIRLVDTRLAALQHQLDGNADNARLDTCVHIQRELGQLLIFGEFCPDYTEGLILFNNCQAIAESLLEENLTNEAHEVFETECLLIAYSDFGRDELSLINARMAEHVVRLFLCLPPKSAANRFRPFINAAMSTLPDPSVFSGALTQAMEKLAITDTKSSNPA